jgi:transcriptional regulator with XRE-family HTH domain
MASVTSLKADLGEYLREQRHGAKLSLRQLADLAGVSNPYLSQIERGLRKPSAEILQQLAKGLRISAESLYVRAGILDEQDDRQVETKAAILADSLLAERQKRVLLDIYDAFCAENLRAAGDTADETADDESGPDDSAAGAADPDSGDEADGTDDSADHHSHDSSDDGSRAARGRRTSRATRTSRSRTTRTTTPKGSS